MIFQRFQRGDGPRVRSREQGMWEAGFVIVGVGVIGWTLHLYNGFESSHASPTARYSTTPSGADHQIESSKSYISSHPDDMNAHVALAMAYYQKGPEHYIEAMNALEKARELGATDDHLFFYAGVMYDALGLPDYAVNELSKYLRHHPNDYESSIRLANLYFRQKRTDDALALYKESLHSWSKDATAWFNYAIINKEKGDYDTALRNLDEVVRIAGHLPEGGLYQQGEIYRLKGDSAKAFQLYQQELAANSNYIPALESTEALIRAKGDLKQARTLRKRIVELKKQSAQPVIASTTTVPTKS